MKEAVQMVDHGDNKSIANILMSLGFPKILAKRVTRNLSPHEKKVLQSCAVIADEMTTFDDIVGLSEAKTVLRRNLQFALTSRSHHFSDFVRIQPGILMHGPPGCGKTMIARAISKDMGFRFLNVKPSIVNDKFFGETEKIIQAFFSLANKLAPCVLFIDEIDGLLGSRDNDSGGSSGLFHDKKIAEFLTAMDGFEKNSKHVVVMGATNRKNKLDSALLRRLPVQLEIPLPNRDAREKIFEKLLKRPGLKVSKKWEKYIQLTDEWNCSKIENFIQFALTKAVEEHMSNESNKNEAIDSKIDDSGSYMIEEFLEETETKEEQLEIVKSEDLLRSRSIIVNFLVTFVDILKYPMSKKVVEATETVEKPVKEYLTVESSHFKDAFKSFDQSDISRETLSRIYS